VARRAQRLELKRAQRTDLRVADEEIAKRVRRDRYGIVELRIESDAVDGAAHTARTADSSDQTRVNVNVADKVLAQVANVRALPVGQQRNAARRAK
jgi:hypothetical protein